MLPTLCSKFSTLVILKAADPKKSKRAQYLLVRRSYKLLTRSTRSRLRMRELGCVTCVENSQLSFLKPASKHRTITYPEAQPYTRKVSPRRLTWLER